LVALEREVQVDGLVALLGGVVVDVDGERLRRLTRREVQRAAGGGVVVAGRRGGAVGRRGVHLGPHVGGAPPRDRDRRRAVVLVDAVGRRVERERRDVVVEDRQRCRRVRAADGRRGRERQVLRRAERDREVLVTFERLVVVDRHLERLGHLAGGEG